MATEKTVFELANETIKKLAKGCSVTNNQTGNTFFINPKQRLCKVVLTKKSLKIECNIALSTELLNELKDVKGIDIEEITPEVAKKKKLGTMKHMVIAIDNSWTEKIINDMLKTWKKN